MAATVTKVKLDRQQTAFIEEKGSNGCGVETGTVEQIGQLMAAQGCSGCQFIFSTQYAPNFKRCFNAYAKRARRIADVAGVTLSDPVEYFIDGYRQDDRWVMTVKG